MQTAILIVFALVLIGLHLWWRNRYKGIYEDWKHARTSLENAQKRHYQEAAQIEAEQQAVFNSMAEGVLILDQTGRIQLVNRSLQELFLLKNEVRGLTILEAFRLNELAEIYKRLPAEQTVTGVEMELPGVTARWAEVNAAGVKDRSGTHHGAIMVFHDLTRIKQLESTRQEFVANVSHELRTPLSLIKGFVETLLEGAKDDPEVSTRFLRTIAKHTDRLTYLIEDLLTISRLESGQIVMNRHQIGLASEVALVVDDLQSRAREKNTVVQNDIAADLTASADSDRLHQVFFNLVENAIKYGKNNGKVTIGGRKLEDGKVEISVCDDGPGIPEESKERIFERFYRVDRARSRETGGTGLGLAIVKHIVSAHGGEVWVSTELGKGSTFFFTLGPE